MKKIFSLLLSFIMLISIVSLNVCSSISFPSFAAVGMMEDESIIVTIRIRTVPTIKERFIVVPP